MKNKKGEVATAIALMAIVIVGLGMMLFIDSKPQITGMAVAGGVAGANIAACGTVSDNSVLTQNITAASASTCLNITTDNVVLDCQGYYIFGNGAGNGIEVQARKNITIKNCFITNFTGTSDVEAMNGIFFKKSNDSMIINSTIYGNRMGVQLFDYSQRNQITGCNISNNLQYQGVYIYSSSYYNIINDSDIGSNGGHGIKITTSSYVNLTNNRIYSNSNNGIEYLGPVSAGHNIIRNNIFSNTQWGIHVDSQTSNVLYENNTALSNGNGDIKIDGTSDHRFLDQDFAGYDLNVPISLTFEKNNKAKLHYIESITATGSSLSSEYMLGDDFVYVNSSNTAFNKRANITFFGLSYGSLGEVKPIYDPERDGIFTDCPSSVCTSLRYNSGAFTYNVTGFTNYSFMNYTSLLNCGLSITQNSHLYQNISNCTGFTIGADNIIFDCQGYTMTGTGSGIGLFIAYNRSNVTIRDCVIRNFTTGITASYTLNSSLITGNTISNCSTGFTLGVSAQGGLNNILTNNIFSGNSQIGLDLRAYSTNITNNNFTSNPIGLRILSSSNNLVENNYFSGNSQAGISIHASNNTIKNATFSGNTMDVLMLVSNLKNISFIDSVIGPYNISSARFSLESTGAGRVEFLNNTYGSSNSLFGSANSDVRIINNTIFVNATYQPGFNVNASLAHYNLQDDQVYTFWDQDNDGSFVRCPSDVCTNKNFAGNTLSYVVNHFTTFKGDSNHLPNVTIPVLSPIPVYTYNNLTAIVNYTDVDSDNGTVFFNWTVDSAQTRFVNYSDVAPGQYVPDVLEYTNFVKNQNLTVYVWAYDGDNYSLIVNNWTMVANSLPTTPIINLTPSVALSSQDLYCNVTINSTDADNDLVNYTYRWYNGSNLIVSTGPTSQLYDVLGFGNTSGGENWSCTVVPYDGQDNGTNSSLTAHINDAPNYITLLTPSNYSYVSPLPLFNWTNSSDYENDVFTYYLEVAITPSFTSLVINISTFDTNYTAASSLGNGTYYWRVNVCDAYECNNYSQTQNKFYVDSFPPNSTITTLTNNSDIGVNSFPINISGESADNIVLGQTWVSINGTFYNVSDPNQYVWNYSWTPASDGEYIIYSMAIDDGGNNETLFEYYYVEVYTTSNLTNATKFNSTNQYSEIFDSEETHSEVNTSTISSSYFINVYSTNCTITGSHFNYTSCDNSEAVSCSGEYWTIDPSYLDNVFGSNNIFIDSNVSNSKIDGSNISYSYINYTNMTSSVVNTSVVYSSNITNSVVTYSTVNESNVTSSTINNSFVQKSAVEGSILYDVNLTNSTVFNSNLTNVTIVNSNVRDMVLNNTVINNDQCSSGTIVYQGTTYTCPINLNTIYTPPVTPPSGGGGGGQPSLQDCRDGKDNDMDGLIDYPADPGCVSSYDTDESEKTCTQSWICTSWTDCIRGEQTRSCTDSNNCEVRLKAGYVEEVIETEKPIEVMGCVVESCDDNIQNQGETGIDCGGPCLSCPTAIVECTKVADCPEGHSCVDNKCVEIPERQPVIPEASLIEKINDFFSGASGVFGAILNFNDRINKVIAEWLKGFWDVTKKIMGEAFDLYMDFSEALSDLVKDLTGRTIEFVKLNYGSTLIVILSIAVLIAGYFAYQSFVHSGRIEKLQEEREEIEKAEKKEEVKESSEELSYFIRDSLLAGHQARQIRENLASKGWSKKVITEYTKKIKETHKEELKTAAKIRKLKAEEERIQGVIRKPEEGIKFWERPEVPKFRPSQEPVVLKTEPVKETKTTKRLAQELAAIKQEMSQPIKTYERPKIAREKIEVAQTPGERLKERVTRLIKSNWSREEIAQSLKSEDWPESVVEKYLDDNFPQLKNISKFKKEAAEIDKTLNELKSAGKAKLSGAAKVVMKK